jgi:hypothetical protein
MLGLVGLPAELQQALDGWTFSQVSALVKTANDLLTNYEKVRDGGAAAGLTDPGTFAKVWGKDTLAAGARAVESQKQALNALKRAAEQLDQQAPDERAEQKLTQAAEAFGKGQFAEAASLASKAATSVVNVDTATKMIAVAREKQASFKEDFFSRIGLMFKDPSGDLAKAQVAFDNGDAETALKLSRSAYDSWNGAKSSGIKRLAVLAALMCGLSFGVYWLLKRLDRGRKAPPLWSGASGHVLAPPEDRRGGWRNWENRP